MCPKELCIWGDYILGAVLRCAQEWTLFWRTWPVQMRHFESSHFHTETHLTHQIWCRSPRQRLKSSQSVVSPAQTDFNSLVLLCGAAMTCMSFANVRQKFRSIRYQNAGIISPCWCSVMSLCRWWSIPFCALFQQGVPSSETWGFGMAVPPVDQVPRDSWKHFHMQLISCLAKIAKISTLLEDL